MSRQKSKIIRVIIQLFLLILPATWLWAQDDELLPTDTADFKSHYNMLLIFEADSGHTDMVQYLLELGADPNTQTEQGVTPLMYASQWGYRDIAELLLKNGANPNLAPFDGNTALHASVKAGNDSIAELLLDYNAEVNVANRKGLTPLHYAVWYGFPYLTDLLIYHGADVNAQDNHGNTPLMLAVYNGTNLCTTLLLESGANPDIQDNEGKSPLMVAAQFNDTLLSKLLLSYNADIKLHDKKNATALALAIANRSSQTIQLLLENNAGSYTLSKSYYQLAAETGSREVLEILRKNGLKTKLKPSIGSIGVGTGFIFNNHEFLWGFEIEPVESISKTGLSVGYWFRPSPVAVLYPKNNKLFQLHEEKQVVSVKLRHYIPIVFRPKGIGLKAQFGPSFDWISRNTSGTVTNPPDVVRLGANAALNLHINSFEITVGWDYTWLKTLDASPHRANINIRYNLPIAKPRIVNKTIKYVR